MSKIYVTQENPGFDYSPLGEFGEPVFVTLNDFSGSSNSLYNEVLMDDIKRAMGKLNPDVDFLAPSGSPLVTAFCVAALRERGVTRFPILRWSNRDRAYRLVVINWGE